MLEANIFFLIHLSAAIDHVTKTPALFKEQCHSYSTYSNATVVMHGNTHELINMCAHANQLLLLDPLKWRTVFGGYTEYKDTKTMV